MTRINLDHSFFHIMAEAGGQPIWVERTVADSASLAETIKDIFDGQVDDIHYIIEQNPAEGWSRNVTETVCESLARIVNSEFSGGQHRPRRELAEFIERHTSIRIPAAYDPTFQAA